MSSPTDNAFFPYVLPITKEDPLFNGPENFPFQNDYYWIVVAACIFGFFTAYGIGANDVANAFATSVGARSLTVMQAVLIAAVCEFGGAVLLGSAVTDTVRKGIVDFKAFEERPDWLMLGMFATIIAVGFWLFAATAFELPVSTTHSVIGGIIGFALCTPAGGDAVKWDKVGMVVLSWFASPILSGIFSAALFGSVRSIILRHENAFDRCLKFFPGLVGVTVWLNFIFIVYKGAKGKGSNKGVFEELWVGVLTGLGIGVGIGIILVFTLIPRMRKNLGHLSDEPAGVREVVHGLQGEQQDSAAPGSSDVQVEEGIPSAVVEFDDQAGSSKSSVTEAKDVSMTVKPTEAKKSRFQEAFERSTNVHKSVDDDARVSSIHDNAEKFSYRTERAFAYLQVFTAIFDSFSHGANDVANSVGPLASVVAIYNTAGESAKSKKTEVPIWILVLGGAGIVVGLATYGYKIMSALGVKMVSVTPSRGFSIELGAALVIAFGSFLGIPLSTTHCQVGATIGVGMLDGWRNAVNWPMLGKIFLGWMFTLVVAGLGTGMIFAFAFYTPNAEKPLAESNCMNIYGTLLENATTMAFEANTTVVYGMEGFP